MTSDAWVREQMPTVAIATCHRSGFVREKAVVVLAECHDGMELPFLLVRLNDWVSQVRSVAATAVSARLSVPYAPHWVRCLALIEQVPFGGRAYHEWLKDEVGSLLQQAASRAALEAGLAAGSRVVRRACVRIAAGLPDSPNVLRVALLDSDPIVHRFAGNVLCKVLIGDALRGTRNHAAGTPPNRCTVSRRLRIIRRSGASRALLDRATSVRELARLGGELSCRPSTLQTSIGANLSVKRAIFSSLRFAGWTEIIQTFRRAC